MTADFEGPIARLVTPLPLELAGAVLTAAARAAQQLDAEALANVSRWARVTAGGAGA